MDYVLEQKTQPHPQMARFGITQEITTVHKRNKSTLSPEDVRKIANKLLQKAKQKNPNAKLSIYATTNMFKNFQLLAEGEATDRILDKDDYLNGRLADDTKFKEYYLVNFYIKY